MNTNDLAPLPSSLLVNEINQAKTYLDNTLSENTKAAYQKAWDDFERFCEDKQLPPLPAAPQTVALYLSHCGSHYKLSTIDQRRAAIKARHEARQLDSPTDHVLVKSMVKGIARTHGRAKSQAKALMKSDLESSFSKTPEKNKDVRDLALLLMGFIGAFRRSELVELNIEDLTFDDKGITVQVKKSKTDQEKKGKFKAIPYASRPNVPCPVQAVRKWVDLLSRGTGVLFVSITKGGKIKDKPLSPIDVSRILKSHCGHDYSAHSLRAGFVTSAQAQGLSNEAIQAQTWHKDIRVLSDYNRPSSIWLNNAATMM